MAKNQKQEKETKEENQEQPKKKGKLLGDPAVFLEE